MTVFGVAFLDPTLYAVLVCAGFVIAVVALIMARLVSLLAWSCVLVFLALAWNALAATG